MFYSLRSFGALRNRIVCCLLLRMLQSDGTNKYICTIWCVLFYSNPVLLIRFRKAIIEFKSHKIYKKCNERINFASSHLNSETECVLREVFHLFSLIKVGVTSTIIFISHFKTEKKTKISFNLDFDFRMRKIHT